MTINQVYKKKEDDRKWYILAFPCLVMDEKTGEFVPGYGFQKSGVKGIYVMSQEKFDRKNLIGNMTVQNIPGPTPLNL